jgi:hypothetical protein
LTFALTNAALPFTLARDASEPAWRLSAPRSREAGNTTANNILHAECKILLIPSLACGMA